MMKFSSLIAKAIPVLALLAGGALAEAQIKVTSARIGCLPIQKDGNLTEVVATACNGKNSCSYKAPTPQEYAREGVKAATRFACTQAMEIIYQCGSGAAQTVTVPGDAWGQPPANLGCSGAVTSNAGGNSAGGSPAGNAHSPFPITRSQFDPINGIGYMQTDITIAGSGQLTAKTHTWSAKDLEGFHGAVAVAVLDEDQRLLWVSGTQNYGVDGKHVPFGGPSDRTDSWGDTVPVQVLSRIHYIAIKQRWNPKPVTPDNIAAWLEGISNDVARELSSVLQRVESTVGITQPPPHQAAPGTIAASVHTAIDATPDEPCPIGRPGGPMLNPQSPGGLLTTDYHLPPAQFLDNPKGVEESDGRLNGILRSQAQLGDAHPMLANAVKAYLSIPLTVQSGIVRVPVPTNPELGKAIAQLAVTGRKAFASFAQWRPQDSDLAQYVRQANPGQKFDDAALKSAVAKVLDVAYTTLWAVRANNIDWRAYRAGMGWIAVSSEDDQPHRPVNTPTAHYPQYDVTFALPGVSGPFNVTTRYMVASQNSSLASPGNRYDEHLDRQPAPRSIPIDERPMIPPQNKIFIYIHGGGSRLEEAVPVTEKLIAAGAKRGTPITVISFDMANSGLSMPFDHTLVANSGPGGALGSYHPPHGDRNKPIPNPPLTYGYPLLDTEEQYVLNFLDAIDRQIGNVKGRIIAWGGGSLGGDMTVRLARRANEYPFLKNIVSWSVTCMQGAADPAMVGHAPVYGLIAKFTEPEQSGTRHDFFDRLYKWDLVAKVLPPQPQLWYRDGWEPCKSSYIQQSKFDRYEYYTPEFRRWQYRLNYELTIFSFQDGDLYAPTKAEGPARYLTVNSRLLLMAGEKDEHDPFYKLYSSTVDVAKKMEATQGGTLFLKNTGHSIHDERPEFLAEQILNFAAPTQSSQQALR